MGSSHWRDVSVKLNTSLTTANCAILLKVGNQKKGKLSLNCPQPFQLGLSLIDPKVALDSHTSPAGNIMRHWNLFSTICQAVPAAHPGWLMSSWTICAFLSVGVSVFCFLSSTERLSRLHIWQIPTLANMGSIRCNQKPKAQFNYLSTCNIKKSLMYIYWAGQFIKNKLFIAATMNELFRPRNLSTVYFRDLFLQLKCFSIPSGQSCYKLALRTSVKGLQRQEALTLSLNELFITSMCSVSNSSTTIREPSDRKYILVNSCLLLLPYQGLSSLYQLQIPLTAQEL